VKVLLDTHTLLWATLSPSHLSPTVAGIIADESNVILVSAASAWEIATKVRIGRPAGAEKLEKEFLDVMEDSGYKLVAIDAALALRAGRFSAEHRDPFDRVLAAHALTDDIPILSCDEKLDSFSVQRIW